jgi:hypothetical protein
VGNAVVIPLVGAVTVLLLADFIPFTQSMPFTNRLVVAMLAGAILVARSPSSAIAIVNELRARGPFTQTVLGVTIITDVVVIFMFAFATSVADALLTSLGFDFGFIGLLLLELLLSLILGFILGKLGEFILSLRPGGLAKSAITLLTDYALFVLSATVRDFSNNWLPFELFLEPLLVCMIGSFVVTNSRYRTEFLKILHDTGPSIYIAFCNYSALTPRPPLPQGERGRKRCFWCVLRRLRRKTHQKTLWFPLPLPLEGGWGEQLPLFLPLPALHWP